MHWFLIIIRLHFICQYTVNKNAISLIPKGLNCQPHQLQRSRYNFVAILQATEKTLRPRKPTFDAGAHASNLLEGTTFYSLYLPILRYTTTVRIPKEVVGYFQSSQFRVISTRLVSWFKTWHNQSFHTIYGGAKIPLERKDIRYGL